MNITHENIGENRVVRLEGRLDAAAVRDHRDELTSIADETNKWLIMNMDKVDFIDSSGLGLIVSLIRRTRERRADLSVCNLSPQAKSLFELTRMARIFSIYPTEESALQAAG
ncbi:MAG: anti-sigma factor antagonist [Gammaproteobacteria bacterium]|nr:MAG: anti-sigma factor antagonist [Gammaproteobacteria bacterium]